MYSKIHFNLVEYPVFYEKNSVPTANQLVLGKNLSG